MELRFNLSMMVNQVLANSRRQTDRLGNLQSQAATGKKLIEPSDDPAGMVALLSAKRQDLQLGISLENMSSATTTLNASVTSLRQVSDILSQARQIAIEGSQTTTTASGFGAMADQVDQLLNRLLDAANTKIGDQYVFAGTASETKPFAITSVNAQGQPQQVTYQGSDDRAEVLVGYQRTLATLYNGSDVFQRIQRGNTTLVGNTGAAIGLGTDSATGQGTLQVRHTLTSYAVGSGVTAGTSSAASDTILGPSGANKLTIIDTSGNGSAGTLSLNGGLAIAFTNADTNLQINGPNGQIVYVNASNITAGFNGIVDITSTGTLSFDAGKTTTAIDFSTNQTVANGETGGIVNINSAGIRAVGDETLDFGGTYDAFQILIALRDDLRAAAAGSGSASATSIVGKVGELERIQNSVLDTVGEQSASLEHLQTLTSNAEDIQLAARKWSSDLENADIAQVVVQLQEQRNQLELTLASLAQVLSVNLLDFLR